MDVKGIAGRGKVAVDRMPGLGGSMHVARDPLVRLATTFLLAIPVINAVADVTTNSGEGSFSTGDVRGAILGVFVLGAVVLRPVVSGLAACVYALLCYQLILVVLGSNPGHVFTASYVKVAISTLLLLAAVRYVRSLGFIDRLVAAQCIGAVVILLHLAVSQIFKIGESVYVADTLYMGGAQVQVSYSLALVVVLAPLGLKRSVGWRRAAIALTAAACLFAIVLILRRGALFGMVGGLLVYLALSAQKVRLVGRMVMPILITVVALLAAADILLERYAARSLEQRPLREEARVFETFRVLDELSTGTARHVLFGSELYNSQAYYGTRRPLHVDYNILLHGSGVVGIGLYLLLHIALVYFHSRWRRRIRGSPLYREFNAAFWGLIAMSMIISLSGSLTNIGYRAGIFITCGAILAVQRHGLYGGVVELGVAPGERPTVERWRRGVGA